MASKRLHTNDTPEVPLCAWHLRKIFWNERLLAKLLSGELIALCYEAKTRTLRGKDSPSLEDAPFTQEFVVFTADKAQEVARCQQFLRPDRRTLGAKGFPDPKQIHIGGCDYHQQGKKNCQHCGEGISTEYDKDRDAWENCCHEANTRLR
jgi:hypothetical protein